jgi:hypothetical protein
MPITQAMCADTVQIRHPFASAPACTPYNDRAVILAALGADEDTCRLLLPILGAPFDGFDATEGASQATLPWEDEPFVSSWDAYHRESTDRGVLPVLTQRLPQLAFPIEHGISATPAYLAATRRGVSDSSRSTALTLIEPDHLRLRVHPTIVGRVPVLITGTRDDFVALVRAFVHRNEPVAVPASMGACFVAGYNNWDRVALYHNQWTHSTQRDGGDVSDTAWSRAFASFAADKSKYQDRFIILSDGPYSDTPASALGLESGVWRTLSLRIRLEHECAHYVTRRLFGAMRLTILDELVADHAGLVRATGQFSAAWFLRFLGLERAPEYRSGGRLQNYLGANHITAEALAILYETIVRAAAAVEQADTALRIGRHHTRTLADSACELVAIARLGIEVLAAPDGAERLMAGVLSQRAVSDSGVAENP